MTAYRIATKSPAEIRRETYDERCARIAAAHEEAKRIGCPYAPYLFRCCDEEASFHSPISRQCPDCGEWVDAVDNPLRKAWLAGFARAQELAE